MKLEQPQDLGLSMWLDRATKDLAPMAKKRIGLEIEAHYLDSVAAHLGDGLLLSEAKAAAVMELGDPVEAGKRFRKQHLTEQEAEKLRQILRWGKRPTMRVAVCFVVVLILSLILAACWYCQVVFPGFRVFLWGCLLLAASCAASVAGPLVVAAKKSSNEAIRFMALSEIISELLFCLGCFGALGWIGLVLTVSSSFRAFPTLRLWLKLKGIAEVAEEAM